MAHVAGDYPLYYDAINEKGLGVAGLNFVGNAVYHSAQADRDNIAQFELIPWLLGQCATLNEARTLIERMNLLNEPFSPQLPLAQLHWLIADREGSLTVESVAEGLRIYENPVGVLTNNPPFPMQMQNLANYRHLSPDPVEATFGPGLSLPQYKALYGKEFSPVQLAFIRNWVKNGYAAFDGTTLALTPAGLIVQNSILAELL